jgi:hypothetical protein
VSATPLDEVRVSTATAALPHQIFRDHDSNSFWVSMHTSHALNQYLSDN